MVHNATNIPAKSVKQIFLRKGMCFNRSLRLKQIPFLKISVLLTGHYIVYLFAQAE